jgi:hypothetical protein
MVEKDQYPMTIFARTKIRIGCNRQGGAMRKRTQNKKSAKGSPLFTHLKAYRILNENEMRRLNDQHHP